MRFLNIRNTEQSKVNQIVTAVITDIEHGVLAKGTQLPSINICSKQQKVSRDTVDKAYQQLKTAGYIISVSGLGFFIKEVKPVKYRILFIAGKFGSGENIFYSSLMKALGENARIDVQYHQSQAETLRDIILDSPVNYHYYIVEPQYFPLLQQRKLPAVMQSIVSKELVLLNKNTVKKSSHYISVFHGGGYGIYKAFCNLQIPKGRYRNICLLHHSGTAQFTDTVQAMKRYSNVHNKKFKVSERTEKNLLQPSTLYIACDDLDLVTLLQLISNSTYTIGQNIGVISLSNDSVFKELLNVSVITTDFEVLGQSVAQMISVKKSEQIQNPLKIIMRGSV